MSCKIPPPGWKCSREEGHEGPCAASQRRYFNPPLNCVHGEEVRLRGDTYEIWKLVREGKIINE